MKEIKANPLRGNGIRPLASPDLCPLRWNTKESRRKGPGLQCFNKICAPWPIIDLICAVKRLAFSRFLQETVKKSSPSCKSCLNFLFGKIESIPLSLLKM
jgi:hypothetical protein